MGTFMIGSNEVRMFRCGRLSVVFVQGEHLQARTLCIDRLMVYHALCNYRQFVNSTYQRSGVVWTTSNDSHFTCNASSMQQDKTPAQRSNVVREHMVHRNASADHDFIH